MNGGHVMADIMSENGIPGEKLAEDLAREILEAVANSIQGMVDYSPRAMLCMIDSAMADLQWARDVLTPIETQRVIKDARELAAWLVKVAGQLEVLNAPSNSESDNEPFPTTSELLETGSFAQTQDKRE